LFDDPITTDLTGTTANLSWQPAKIINGSGTIKYTVTIFGKTVCETEGTSCVLTQLKPETNYIAAITARDKDGKLISTVSSAPAYITSYLAFRTLSGQMTSYIEFPGPVTKTKIDDHSVSLSWQAAELCKAGDPGRAEKNSEDRGFVAGD